MIIQSSILITHNSLVTLSVTTIWHFLLGACVPLHVLACKGKNCSDYAENVRRCHTKFSHMGDLERKIGAFLVQGMVLVVVMSCTLFGG
jgi:hypothetical protein